jgi:hypothetical protein
MALYSFRKRVFLNPVSTNKTSYVHAYIESSFEGSHKWGDNVLQIADCHRRISLEFCLGNARDRRVSLKKIDLLISILTSFRDALAREIALIEKSK